MNKNEGNKMFYSAKLGYCVWVSFSDLHQSWTAGKMNGLIYGSAKSFLELKEKLSLESRDV